MKTLSMIWIPVAFGGPVAALADPSLECSVGLSSQVEIAACVVDAEENVDRAVEVALKFAMRSAGELDEITGRQVSVPALAAGQAAWEAYRDAHCEYVGSTFGGGSGTGIAIRSCRVELGRLRVSDLTAQAR